MTSASALLLDAHGLALRLVAKLTGKHFQGLGQASRLPGLTSRLRRQLRDLDVAAAFVRHITEPRITMLLQDIEAGFMDIEAGFMGGGMWAEEVKASRDATHTGAEKEQYKKEVKVAADNKQDKKVVAVDGADMGEGVIEVELLDLNRLVVEAGLVAFGWQEQEKKKLKMTAEEEDGGKQKMEEEEDGGKAVEGAAGGEVAAGRRWKQKKRTWRPVVKKKKQKWTWQRQHGQMSYTEEVIRAATAEEAKAGLEAMMGAALARQEVEWVVGFAPWAVVSGTAAHVFYLNVETSERTWEHPRARLPG